MCLFLARSLPTKRVTSSFHFLNKCVVLKFATRPYLKNVGRVVIMFEEDDPLSQPSDSMARELFSHELQGHGLETTEVEL